MRSNLDGYILVRQSFAFRKLYSDINFANPTCCPKKAKIIKPVAFVVLGCKGSLTNSALRREKFKSNSHTENSIDNTADKTSPDFHRENWSIINFLISSHKFRQK